MVRSKAAFRFSVRTLFEQCERPYFWTFTLRECLAIDEAVARWNKLQKSLYKYGLHPETGEQTVIGLRVFELHPGGHGLHVHVLLNRRLNIHAVRRRCRRFGFGWIHVCRVRSSEHVMECADYMSKYMSKQDRPECLAGRRLWAAIGKWGATRCLDIEVESEFVAAYHARRRAVCAEAAVAEKLGVPYRLEHQLETLEWARHHVFEVKTGQRQALRPDLLSDLTDRIASSPDLKDWDGAFSNLTAQAGHWSKGEWISEEDR